MLGWLIINVKVTKNMILCFTFSSHEVKTIFGKFLKSDWFCGL